MKDLNLETEELRSEDIIPEADSAAGELAEPKRVIQPAALKTLVAAYLIWVIEEIIAGIIHGHITGKSVILLSAACMVLSGGVVWLIGSEWIRYRKKQREQQKPKAGADSI